MPRIIVERVLAVGVEQADSLEESCDEDGIVDLAPPLLDRE